MGRRHVTNWPAVKFGDVVRNVAETCRDVQAEGLDRYLGLEHMDGECLHIRRWGDLATDEVSFTRRFRKGQVLFGKRRAYQRKVAVADFDGVCSSDILCFEPKDPKALLPELLPFIVQSDGFFDHALGTSAGSLSPRTRWSQLKDYEFSLPPLDEQRRIAEILWAADEVTESWLAAGSEANALVDKLTSAFLSGESVQAHERHMTCYGMLPVEWDVVPCSQVFASPPRNGWSAPANAEGRGYPTLSIGAVRDGKVIPDGNVKLVDATEQEVRGYFLQPGDVLVVRGNGNRGLCARCGIVTEVPEGCFYPDLLIRVAFDTTRLMPDFAVLQWNSPTVHRNLLSRAKSTNGIWKVNGKDLRKHELIVPPLSQQQAFMHMIAGPCAAASEMGTHLTRARNMRAGLLNTLTGGQK